MLPESATDLRISPPISVIVFWMAIGLPLIYLPLFLSGIGNLGELLLFLGLFGIHVVALRWSRDYRRGST